MSESMKDIATEIRTQVFDPGTGREVFAQDLIYAKIDSSLRRVIAPKLNLGKTYDTAVLTFNDQNNTYALTNTTAPQVSMIRQVHTQGRGRDLDIIPYEVMMARLNNIIVPSRVKGYPMECALWEQPDQSIQIKFYPWPNGDDVVDLMWSLLPTKVSDETDLVPLDASGIGALVFDVASTLLAGMNQEKATALRVDKNYLVPLYEKKRDQCLRDSRIHINSLRPVGSTRHAATRR